LILYQKGVHWWALFVFNLYPGSIFAEKDDRGFDDQPLVGSSRYYGGQGSVFGFDGKDTFIYEQRFESI
jgi:hypothetical protein